VALEAFTSFLHDSCLMYTLHAMKQINAARPNDHHSPRLIDTVIMSVIFFKSKFYTNTVCPTSSIQGILLSGC
jgi:hypothetical protein